MPAHPLLSALDAAWPAERWRQVSVLVAISGGPDSVALLRAIVERAAAVPGPGRIIAAHYNHRLRPTAERDEHFVIELCRQLNVPLETQTAVAAGSAAEDAARSARYAFLQDTSERLGARYVALGHTADDQAETILHRILRGTGLHGLAGMPVARSLGPAATVIRPLLGCRRGQVLDYLSSLGQDYCSDETNEALHYTRNRIRHHLLPELETHFNPEVRLALLRLGDLAGEAATFIENEAAELLAQALRPGEALTQPADSAVIDCLPLEVVSPFLVCEMFVLLWKARGWPQQGMHRVHWQQLAAAAQGPLGGDGGTAARFHLPGSIDVQRHGARLTLSRPAKES